MTRHLRSFVILSLSKYDPAFALIVMLSLSKYDPAFALIVMLSLSKYDPALAHCHAELVEV